MVPGRVVRVATVAQGTGSTEVAVVRLLSRGSVLSSAGVIGCSAACWGGQQSPWGLQSRERPEELVCCHVVSQAKPSWCLRQKENSVALIPFFIQNADIFFIVDYFCINFDF